MWKKKLNQITLTGIGSWVLAVLPLFQEGSSMNITSWALLAIGTGLFFWGIFRNELGFFEKKVILEQRQEYIPLFRQVVDKMLVRMKELAVEAGKLPLEEYYDKYLKLNNTYGKVYLRLANSHKDEVVRHKVAIAVALYEKGFWNKNTYLYELEDKDIDGMVSLKKEYSTYLARVNDRSLSSDLKHLFKQVRISYSEYSLAEIAKNNELPFKDPKYINVFYEKSEILESLVSFWHKSANRRMDVLLRGGDL